MLKETAAATGEGFITRGGASWLKVSSFLPGGTKRKEIKLRYSRLILPAVLSVAGAVCYGQAQTQPDNTKVNQRDRSAAEPTADQQKSNAADMRKRPKLFGGQSSRISPSPAMPTISKLSVRTAW